ncbi:MAG: hypothetical protein QG602_312 [Verrucomicrobiota bacterium]|nr:hypothetical protein [Verrucomicrobiota bacterium]
MRTNLRFIVVNAVLIAGVLAGLSWHWRTTETLRAELDRERAALARLQASRQAEQQEQQLAAARARAEELDRLLAERATVARLQTELATLRDRAREMIAVGEARTPVSVRPSLVGNVLVFSLWKNSGRATPEAAFETGLWASANGDIDTLTGLLVFDAEARNEAAALYARLPETLRREFVSPERLVAVLAAKDVPLGSATILSQFPTANETKVSAQIFDADGKHRMALLSLRSDEAGWRFVVPANAVKRYAAWLRPAAAAPTP